MGILDVTNIFKHRSMYRRILYHLFNHNGIYDDPYRYQTFQGNQPFSMWRCPLAACNSSKILMLKILLQLNKRLRAQYSIYWCSICCEWQSKPGPCISLRITLKTLRLLEIHGCGIWTLATHNMLNIKGRSIEPFIQDHYLQIYTINIPLNSIFSDIPHLQYAIPMASYRLCRYPFRFEC